VAGNIQGAPANALVSILKFHGIHHILKWVDDFCVFQTPIIKSSPLPLKYAFDISSIQSIMDPLGIPWQPIRIKGQDFTTTVPYIRFIWDLANCLVSLSAKKITQIYQQGHCLSGLGEGQGYLQGMYVHTWHPTTYHLCI